MPKLKKEQEKAVGHEQGNVLVAASAGSGKTFVMIERLIRLIIEKKTSVSNVLCVTYMEKAAAEMKEKLKKAISKKIAEGVDLTEEYLLVDNADISTIHGFCARLVRRYFFIAGVSPDYKIADDARVPVLKQEAIDKAFNKLYQEKDEDFLFLLKRYRSARSDSNFKELIKSIYDFLQGNANPSKYLEETFKIYTDMDYACKRYKDFVMVTLNNVKKYCEELDYKAKNLDFEPARKYLGTILAYIDEVERGDIYSILRFEAYKIASRNYGRKLSEEKEALKGEVNKAYDIVSEQYKRISKYILDKETDAKIGLEVKSHLEKIVKVANLYGELYSEAKREENLLDFADLEHFALKVLADEETLKAVRNQYKYIFADEYQDVNDAQEEILSKISNNNVFMVGDVKQSIYGFRGCRPEIFENKEKEMEARGEKPIRLNYNFRSAKAVLDMANAIFSYSMTEDFYGVNYLNTAMLVPGGIYPDEKIGRACLHFLEKDTSRKQKVERNKVYDLLEEAEIKKSNYPSNIALLIESIIKKELGKTYYDTKLEEERRITYSDIVLLNRKKDNPYIATVVSDLIRLGVPVSAEVSVNVLDFPEVQMLVSLLKLIDVKEDDISLVSVLKSPVGAFTDGELLQIARLYKERLSTLPEGNRPFRTFYNAYKYALGEKDFELYDRLNSFDKYIDELRIKADFLGAGKLLELVIAEKGIEDYLIAKGEPNEKFKRISFFVKSSMSSRIYTVHEFLEHIDKSKDAFEVKPSAVDNAVRVMTVHKSKGLEFPVVIVFGLERATKNKEEEKPLFRDNQLGLCAKSYDDDKKEIKENFFRGLFLEKMRIENLKEELRLLYVAVTRASYSMHLTLEAGKDKRREYFMGASSFTDYIPSTLEANQVSPESLIADLDEGREKRSVLVGKIDSELASKIKANLEFSYPYLESTTLPVKSSVTKATKSAKEEETPIYYISHDDETGVVRGIVAHKILELLDFDGLEKESFTIQVDKMVQNNLISSEDATLVDLEKLESAVNSFAGRVKGKKLYREQNFIAGLDSDKVLSKGSEKMLLQGIIDLLVIDEGGAEIIDYKYSMLKGESLKNKYKSQLDLYAMAVENSLNVKVKRKTLVNVLSGECVDF